MFLRFATLALAALAVTAVPAGAQTAAITPEDLREHIDVLASDAYHGRRPGGPGDALTTHYIVRALAAAGVEPAGQEGGWLQPVALVERGTGAVRARWASNGREISLPADSLTLTGRDAAAAITDAPVIFAGHGVVLPDRGIDQLAGADLRGAVALVLFEGPAVEGFPTWPERVRTLAEAGAVAVIGIVSPDLPLDALRAPPEARTVRLESDILPPAYGAMSWEAAVALVAGGGADLPRLVDEQPGSSFRSVTLPIRASLDVTTPVRRFASNNVIGRIRGNGGSSDATILLLAHWDHLGACGGENAADRICNGAVDNASGIATLIEAAERLASGPRPPRDILILATTAEEMGLLGAEQFARAPPVPRESIVAAINVDTPAIGPRGLPVAVIGNDPALEAVVARTAVGLGRELDPDREADALLQRQDGWALIRAGIPTIMAGGSFSDMERLGAFLSGRYHGPDDELTATTELGGAAEDADLLVALARAFANPATFSRPRAAP
jgi:hypothetical protein